MDRRNGLVPAQVQAHQKPLGRHWNSGECWYGITASEHVDDGHSLLLLPSRPDQNASGATIQSEAPREDGAGHGDEGMREE